MPTQLCGLWLDACHWAVRAVAVFAVAASSLPCEIMLKSRAHCGARLYRVKLRRSLASKVGNVDR